MSDLTKKYTDLEGKQTDISKSLTNRLGVGGNIDARDISQNNTTCNFQVQGPTSINVNSEDQLRRLRCSNLDQPSSSRTEDAIVTDLTEKLKEWYSDLQLPLVSWMSAAQFSLDEYYMPLQLNWVRRTSTNEDVDYDRLREKTRLGSQSDNVNCENVNGRLEGAIDLADMFEPVYGISLKRILVEGQPGFGKTTLAHKIMHDWRKEENYAKGFDFALLIPVRYLKDKTLRELVLERLEEKDNGKVWNLINSDRTLLVLDGLDEVRDSASIDFPRENILKMLYDKISNKMTIVVTCRTGLFKLDESEKNSLFLGLAKRNDFWDKKIEILGFDDKSRERFLKKFVKRESYDKFVEKFTEVINRNLLRSPLILILFVFISEDVQTFTINTQTELYKKLVDCIIKRSVSKDEKVKLGENFTIFGNENSGEYKANFCKFGQISIDNILNNNLLFECDNLTDIIYGMGFLMKHETMKNKFKVNAHYEGYHLTFLEFAAAFSLWDQFEKNKNKFLIVDKMNEICLKKGSSSMVLPFLCGLMGSCVEKLFEQLLDFRLIYSMDTDLMLTILRECELDGCKIIENFLPRSLDYKFSYPFLINKNLNNYGNINVSCADILKLTEFKNICAESVCVTITSPFSIELYGKCNFKNNVKCENIFIEVGAGSKIREIADQFDLILNGVSCSCKHLLLTESCDKNLINECVKNGVLKNQTIEHLYFCLSANQIDIELLENIIKYNTVKKLELWLSGNFKNIDKIIPIVASSPDLLSLTLMYCLNCPLGSKMPEVDLTTITNNGGKCWRHIDLHGIILKNGASISNNECIESLDIIGGFCDVETILALKFSTLGLSYELCDRLMLKQSACLKSVTELTLDMSETKGARSLDSLRCLDKFTKLKKVTLLLGGQLESEQQRDIVKCLRSLKVDHLNFWCFSDWLVTDVVNCVKDLLDKNELESIGNIAFVVVIESGLEVTKYIDYLSAVKLALLSDSKVTAQFVKSSARKEINILNSDEWRFIFNTFDFRQFNIQQRNKILPQMFWMRCNRFVLLSWSCGDVFEIQKRARQ